MSLLIVIPARMASNRFPGKPLAKIGDKPLLWHTYQRALGVKDLLPNTDVVIATPDDDIYNYCAQQKIRCMDTNDEPTGTHRVAYVASYMHADKVVNWQVDEPMVPAYAVVEALTIPYPIATLVALPTPSGLLDWNTVKVAVSDNGICRWFSRTPLAGAKLHCGVYCFDGNTIRSLYRVQPTALSRAESLEQLAWIEHGFTIGSVMLDSLPQSVNTPKDIQQLLEEGD